MDIAGRRDSFLKTTPLCVILLVIIISASSGKAATNLLLTREILNKNSKLGYPNSKVSLKLEGDCNLVLYNDKGRSVWESDTSHYSIPWPECTVSFTDNGRLLLNGTGLFGTTFSWITPNADSKVGKYAAVLRPEGKLSIYGPRVWAVGDGKESISSNNNGDEIVSSIANLKSSQTVYNVLFSGQELQDNSKLTDGEYSFILQECELILKKSNGEISWRTWTRENRKCIAKLNRNAELSILDGPHATVWINELVQDALPGEYALVMQKNGNAVIYGPEVWSTTLGESGLIQMRTADK